MSTKEEVEKLLEEMEKRVEELREEGVANTTAILTKVWDDEDVTDDHGESIGRLFEAVNELRAKVDEPPLPPPTKSPERPKEHDRDVLFRHAVLAIGISREGKDIISIARVMVEAYNNETKKTLGLSTARDVVARVLPTIKEYECVKTMREQG